MSSVAVTVDLPEEMVQRARAKGIRIETFVGSVIAESLQTALEKLDAAEYLLALAEDLRALPDEEKPTPEEIETWIDEFWAARQDE